MKKRSITALLILFCIVVALAFSASAAETKAEVNKDKNSILTLKYSKDRELPGATFSLYKVGEFHERADGDYSFELTGSFKSATGVQLPDLSFWSESDNAQKTGDTANTLVEYVDGDNVEADISRITNEYGEALFSGLKPGLYLARGEAKTINGTTYIPQSFLIPLPYPAKDQETNEDAFSYKMTAYVKYENAPDTVTVSAKKVWAESGTHPDSVTVQLYRDGTLFGEQTLNNGNGWSYEWTGLETGHNWRVNEVNIPDGYTATVNSSQSENKLEFTITNTRSDTKPPDEQNTITVKKVWAGSGTHPDSVTVQLYRDGTLFGEQTLSNGNGWSYTWTTTAGNHAWSVEEVNDPDGYTVNIAWAGNTATVTNTRNNTQTPSGPTSPPGNPDDPSGPNSPPGNSDGPSGPNSPPGNSDGPSGPNSPPGNPDDPSGPNSPPDNPNDPGTPPDDPGLPQTGQLWWPVPLLAVAGALLLLIGAALFLRKEDPHE